MKVTLENTPGSSEGKTIRIKEVKPKGFRGLSAAIQKAHVKMG